MSDKSRKVSLVLGSGGARGLTQIGIIHRLEELSGYDIKSIAGSSMGALIGGIYAAGKLDVYEDWVKSLNKHDVIKLLDFAFSRSGLFSGERLMQELEDLLGDIDIEDLPVSFTAVATDIETGREIWLNKGSLFKAIRASIAIPTVFTPVQYEDRVLVDGGLVNPVPIAPTLRDRTEMTIAVSLSGKAERLHQSRRDDRNKASDNNKYQQAISDFLASLQSRLGLNDKQDEIDVFDIISRSIETMQNTIARFKLAAYNPDVLIEIPVNACGMFEFYRAREMIELGYERARAALGNNHNEDNH